MIQEIEAAVTFLTRLVAKSVDPVGSTSSKTNSTSHHNKSELSHKMLTEDKIQEFSRKLTSILQNRFRNHWYPEKPARGQAYRCIRINQNCKVDTSIEQACNELGYSYDALRLPVELTLWIDPNEVTCRFGEHKGSYCVVAKLRDGRQENYVDQINIEELEQRSMERSKQSSFDIVHSRKKRQQSQMLNQHRTKNSPISLFNTTNSSNSPSYHTHHQSLNGSLANGAATGHLGSSPAHPHVPVTSTTQNMNGYVDAYGPNGLLPTTNSAAAASMQQFHFGNPHFYPNSAPNPFHQQHHGQVAQHSSHFSSPNNHLFSKFNISMQQSQQGPSPGGQMTNIRLNTASMASSGTFRSSLATSTNNSIGSKHVGGFQSPSNSHHVSATSPVIASLGTSHHNSNGASKGGSIVTNSAGSVNNASSFARDYQSMDKDRRHLNASATVPSATTIISNRF